MGSKDLDAERQVEGSHAEHGNQAWNSSSHGPRGNCFARSAGSSPIPLLWAVDPQSQHSPWR
jgi:hypothetical protein